MIVRSWTISVTVDESEVAEINLHEYSYNRECRSVPSLIAEENVHVDDVRFALPWFVAELSALVADWRTRH